MLGRYIWDLEAGDVFTPVEYDVTQYVCAEYAHGVESDYQAFYSSKSADGRQVRPPTMIHVDKLRLLAVNCPGGTGPHARIHYEYHSRHHSPAYVGDHLIVSGRITERYVKRGRTYIEYDVDVRASDGRLITTYTDKTLLRYEQEEKADE